MDITVTDEQLESFRAQLEAMDFHCPNCNASAAFITPIRYLKAHHPDSKEPIYAVTLQSQKCGHSAMNAHLTAPADHAN